MSTEPTRTKSPSKACVRDVYVEITVEKCLRVKAVTEEEAGALALARVERNNDYITRHKLKIVQTEVVDVVTYEKQED
jgi:hypothetical protein